MNTFPGLNNHWFILCQSRQLRGTPLKRSLLGVPLVLFRTADGQAAAFVDRCPHRNAPLSSGRMNDGRIVCPYHGWQFDGGGQCQAVPGLVGEAWHPARKAEARAVVEQDGFVWAYAGVGEAPATEPRRFDHLNQKGYARFVGEAVINAALPDALENFLDGTHTHFVHAGLIRAEDKRKETTAIVRRRRDGVEAEYLDEGQQSGLIAKLFGAGIDDVFGRFILPSVAQLEYCARGQTKMLITLCFTPQEEYSHRLFAVVAGQAPPWARWLAVPVIKLLFWQALRQDQAILELQTRNLRAFGGPQYVYTELDVLGAHILRLLKHGPSAEIESLPEQRIKMMM